MLSSPQTSEQAKPFPPRHHSSLQRQASLSLPQSLRVTTPQDPKPRLLSNDPGSRTPETVAVVAACFFPLNPPPNLLPLREPAHCSSLAAVFHARNRPDSSPICSSTTAAPATPLPLSFNSHLTADSLSSSHLQAPPSVQTDRCYPAYNRAPAAISKPQFSPRARHLQPVFPAGDLLFLAGQS